MSAGSEVFALTDEQIVGVEEETAGVGRDSSSHEGVNASHDPSTAAAKGAASARDDKLGIDGVNRGDAGKGLTPEGVSYRDGAIHSDGKSMEVPQWLAERMKDPWHGDEAKELWDDKQRTEKEVAAYREVFATAEDARALKEIYPGGLSAAKAAAERARELEAIDAAFYRGDSAARAQLARQMMQQDPAAFREMVEAGVRLLGETGKEVAGEEGRVANERGIPRSADSARNDGTGVGAGERSRQDASATLQPEIVNQYREFERAANAELEKSVGGAITRMMEQALPNLRHVNTAGQAGAHHAAPLRERLSGAVREEVEAALKSDEQLGEQVAKILAGRRFDEGARAQVVRLIDARAQQLVPGAVRRVVGSWTQATLGARGSGRNSAEAEREESGEAERRAMAPGARKDGERAVSERSEKASAARREAGTGRGRRVDYGRISDEEILGI